MEPKNKTRLIRISFLIPALTVLSWLLYLVFVPATVMVDSALVKRGVFLKIIRVDGILRSKDRYIVPAYGDGDIKRVDLKVGDEVKKGQAVAQLIRDTDYLPVKSPISGVVSKVFRENAGPIFRGEPIVEVIDPKNLEIMAELLTTDASQVQVGDQVIAKGLGQEGSVKAEVVRVSKAGFIKPSALGVEEEKTEVIADIRNASSGILQRLGSNFHADVSIEVEKVNNALILPIGALFRSGKDWAVYKIINHRAHESKIKIQSKSDEEAMIESGLSEHDRVILFPGDLVREGSKVKTQ